MFSNLTLKSSGGRRVEVLHSIALVWILCRAWENRVPQIEATFLDFVAGVLHVAEALVPVDVMVGELWLRRGRTPIQWSRWIIEKYWGIIWVFSISR